jgi:hypothetical protein
MCAPFYLSITYSQDASILSLLLVLHICFQYLPSLIAICRLTLLSTLPVVNINVGPTH